MNEADDIRSFTLDFSECNTIMELYAVIKKELELPDWFGENLSAFWDSLTGIMYVPAEITVKYRLCDPEIYEYIQQLIDIMREAEKKFPSITVKLTD